MPRFKAPMRVRKLEVEALHEPWGKNGKRKAESGNALTRPCGHPLPSDGRGAGGEGSFACRFKAPIRVHEQVEATHEPTRPREKDQSPSTGLRCTSLPAYALRAAAGKPRLLPCKGTWKLSTIGNRNHRNRQSKICHRQFSKRLI